MYKILIPLEAQPCRVKNKFEFETSKLKPRNPTYLFQNFYMAFECHKTKGPTVWKAIHKYKWRFLSKLNRQLWFWKFQLYSIRITLSSRSNRQKIELPVTLSHQNPFHRWKKNKNREPVNWNLLPPKWDENIAAVILAVRLGSVFRMTFLFLLPCPYFESLKQKIPSTRFQSLFCFFFYLSLSPFLFFSFFYFLGHCMIQYMILRKLPKLSYDTISLSSNWGNWKCKLLQVHCL